MADALQVEVAAPGAVGLRFEPVEDDADVVGSVLPVAPPWERRMMGRGRGASRGM